MQRRQLSLTMTNEVFLAQFEHWIREMRGIGATKPGTGACTLASAMTLWLWTLHHLQKATDADGAKLYKSSRQGVTFPLADALCWLLAARFQILDVLELEARGGSGTDLHETAPGFVRFFTDLCHVQSAHAAGEVGRITAELVYGYNRHPSWDDVCAVGCCTAQEVDDLDTLIPGYGATARSYARRDRGRRVARREGGAVRAHAGPADVPGAPRQDGRLPHGRTAGEGSGRRRAHEGDDPRGARLPGVEDTLDG